MRRIMLHGLRTMAFLFALAPRAHAPTRHSEGHVMSANTMNAADFRVTNVLRPQPRWEEFLARIAASGANPPDTGIFDGAAAHARHTPLTIPVRQEWSAGHQRRCRLTAKDMIGADR